MHSNLVESQIPGVGDMFDSCDNIIGKLVIRIGLLDNNVSQ